MQTKQNFIDALVFLLSFLLLLITWYGLFWLLGLLQEVLFDPWDVLPSPIAGTLPATLRRLIAVPLFILFIVFVYAGGIVVGILKIGRTQHKAVAIWHFALSHLFGLAVIVLIGTWSDEIADLWASRNFTHFTRATNFNYYLRTGPFIILCFLVYGLIHWQLLRTNSTTWASRTLIRNWVIPFSLLFLILVVAGAFIAGSLLGQVPDHLFWRMYHIRSTYAPLVVIIFSGLLWFLIRAISD